MPKKIIKKTNKKELTTEEKKIKLRLQTLRSILRRAWSRYPERYAVLNEAKRKYIGPNKRQKIEFKCAVCGNYFKASDVSVDHINPVSTLTMGNIGEWVLNLFCFKEALQVLCKKCHDKKSAEENRIRRELKNENK